MTECRWTYDSDDLKGESYFTGCDNRNVAWETGTPAEHGYKYCPYCGRALKLTGRERPRPLRGLCTGAGPMTRQLDPPDEAALRALAERIASSQTPLTPDVAQALYANLWDLYGDTVQPDSTLADLRARLAAAERESRYVFCLRCDWRIEYTPGDEAARKQAVADAFAHDDICPAHPLRKELESVRARLAAVTAERDDLRQRDRVISRQLEKRATGQDDYTQSLIRDLNAEMERTKAAEQQRDTARALLSEARTRLPATSVYDALRDRIDAALSAPEGRPDDDPGPECSICRRPGRHTHACE